MKWQTKKTLPLVTLRELGKNNHQARVSKLLHGNEDPDGAYPKYGRPRWDRCVAVLDNVTACSRYFIKLILLYFSGSI
jgi:hypothetical protein